MKGIFESCRPIDGKSTRNAHPMEKIQKKKYILDKIIFYRSISE